jgi:pyruvate,water dikinase
VLVALHSSPKFSRVMTHCAAIVTDRGSPTGHMAILSREFGVPTIVGLAEATRKLADDQVVTVDATSARIYEGMVPTVEKAGEAQAPADSPAVQKLRRIAKSVTPLKLIDPASRNFTAANCASLHDITRFVHEKVFEVMFRFSDRADYDARNSFKLEGNLPYDVWVLDVGGGFADGAGKSGRVAPADIASAPLQSFLEGLLDPRIKWDQPRAVSARGFMSVLGESMAGPPAEVQGVGKASFAIISDRYMNFSTKAGYHFNTVDTYCGKSLNKNYIHFRFAGGGAGEERRARRCRFLTVVLEGLDFKVKCRGDLLVARLEKYDREFIRGRLAELGRLTLCSRQLDMLMDTDQSPELFARAFLAGELDKF